MPKEIPRALCLPPAGRPRWVSVSGVELSYLSWGARRYDRNPIPISRHTGWVYFCLLKGSAELPLASGGARRLRAGSCAILHPDCACGISAGQGRASEILTWVWREAPEFPALQPATGGMVVLPLSGPAMDALRRLHRETRAEAQTIDQFATCALRALHARVDLALVRRPRTHAPDHGGQADLALEWMRQNLHARQPVGELCAYLGVSAPTLFRLFQKRVGESPRACFQAMRLERARALLAAGALVKEAAAALGYAHPGDLGRALKTKRFLPRKLRVA